MNKNTLKTIIIVAVFAIFLSSCVPIIQGVSTVTSVVSLSNDRRSAGVIVDDNTLFLRLNAWANSAEKLQDSHLNFMVYDKTVLVVGEVPSAAESIYIDEQIKQQNWVINRVENETRIAPNSNILGRTKDSIITAQVELSFKNQQVFNSSHVRVTTENQVVYLMGAVTQYEADKATELAAKTKGTHKVVNLFQILKSRPAAEIERDRLDKIKAAELADIKSQKAELEAQKNKLQKQIDKLEGNTGTSF